MSNVIRQSPYISPDTFRKKLHLDQNFFNGYIPKSISYEQANGTKYVGNIQNWGSEQLLEVRKLKLNRPPLEACYAYNDIFNQFFSLQYSDEISTYEQENPVMCLLKKDCLHGKSAYIEFHDVKSVILPRPDASSEYRVHTHRAWMTKTPPELVIERYPGGFAHGEYDTHPLIIVDPETGTADGITYWFHNTWMESEAEFVSATQAPNEAMFLNPSECIDDVLQTVPLEVWMEGLPFIWLTNDALKTLPDIGFQNNIGLHDWPILTTGSDGHGHHYLYLFAYGEKNLPGSLGGVNGKWQIKVYPKYDDFQTLPYDANEKTIEKIKKHNLQRWIKEIQFIRYTGNHPETDQDEAYYQTIHVTFNMDNVNIKLIEDGKWGYSTWNFKHSVEGDQDYDLLKRHNPIYGYINDISSVYQNNSTYKQNYQLYPIFEIVPSHIYRGEFRDDDIRRNVVIGIHTNSASEYSDNGVIKHNGTIHRLGDFDGLAPYYYYKLPKDIARSHTELYAIEDADDMNNQRIQNKLVAGLLVDAAIPHNEVDTIVGLSSAIVFNRLKQRTYETIEQNVISINNVLSDIGYVNREHFMDVHHTDYTDGQAFIYHGNRSFSCNIIGELDPVLETGRVYYVNNDGIDYVNNDKHVDKRPARTIARICDIPTKLTDLMNVKGKAPTILFDQQYVRTDFSYTENDFNRVWGILNNGIFLHDRQNRYVFDSMEDLKNALSFDVIREQGYFILNNPHYQITMQNGLCWENVFEEYKWIIVNGGKDYSVGDVLQAYVGGHLMKGVVKQTVDGTITEIGPYDETIEDDISIPIRNFNSQYTRYLCETISRSVRNSLSTGCVLELRIDNLVWQSQPLSGLVLAQMYSWNMIDGLHAFCFDEIGNLWLCECQYHEDEEVAIDLIKKNFLRPQLDGETDEQYQEMVLRYWNAVENLDRKREYMARAGWQWVQVSQLTGSEYLTEDCPYDSEDTRSQRMLTNILLQNDTHNILSYSDEIENGFHQVDVLTPSSREKILFVNRNVIMTDEAYTDYQETIGKNVSKTKAILDHFLPKYLQDTSTPLLLEGFHYVITLVTISDVEYVRIDGYSMMTDTQELRYPAGHHVAQKSTGHLPTRLSFGNLEKSDTLQPTVFLYNPIATYYRVYDANTYGEAQLLNKYDIAIEEYAIDIGSTEEREVSNSRIYVRYTGYDAYEVPLEEQALVILKDHNPQGEAEDDEDYEERLKTLQEDPDIMEECMNEAIQTKNQLSYHPNYETDPLPIQQIDENGILPGAYQVISTRQYPGFAMNRFKSELPTSLFYFFKLEDDVPLNGFRMKDAFTGADISEQCLIYRQNRLYYFNTSTEKWTRLRGKDDES